MSCYVWHMKIVIFLDKNSLQRKSRNIGTLKCMGPCKSKVLQTFCYIEHVCTPISCLQPTRTNRTDTNEPLLAQSVFPTIYDNPYFALYRHVIYCWKALGLNLKNPKTGGALLLEVRPYWGIYGILLSPSLTHADTSSLGSDPTKSSTEWVFYTKPWSKALNLKWNRSNVWMSFT